MELWREIPGFQYYEISNRGRVRSWLNTGYGTNLRSEPKILKPGKIKGYYFVYLRPTGKKSVYKNMRINRLVLLSFVGKPPSSAHQAEHLNGKRDDNRLKNLRWATPLKNNLRKNEHGTQNGGTLPGKGVKLSRPQINEVKKKYASGRYTMRELESEYPVSRQTIHNIVHDIHFYP